MVRNLFNFETFGLLGCIGVLLACAGASSTRIGKDTYSIECKRKRGRVILHCSGARRLVGA